MIACYDLARCPPTYDVVAFLALAELERIRRGEDRLEVHILPGPAEGFRRDSLWPRSIEARRDMLERVALPLCELLPSVRYICRHSSPAVAQTVSGWGKGEYHISLPAIMRALRGGCRPLRAPAAPRRMRGLITFTLREAEHHPLRNSRTEDWIAAAQILRERGVGVLVVRDSTKADEPFPSYPDVPVIASAARNVAQRAQLYGHAALNVGICNGPMWMSIFMDAPTLMLRPTTNEAGGCYDDRFYASHGLPRGSQLPTSPPHQRLVWEEDRCDNIVRAVEEMLATCG